jgi:hypothetical protein
MSQELGLDWPTALTWNDAVTADVTGFVRSVRPGAPAGGPGTW